MYLVAGQPEGSPWLRARICFGVIHLRTIATRWSLQFVIPFNNQTEFESAGVANLIHYHVNDKIDHIIPES